MSNYEKITRKIWEETRLYNIDFQGKIYGLYGFTWPIWKDMIPEIKKEYLEWVSYLIENDLPFFSASERHSQAVENRIKNGWQLGERRCDFIKEDPYLVPLDKCPDWFQDWCVSRDNIMIKILKEELRNVKQNTQCY